MSYFFVRAAALLAGVVALSNSASAASFEIESFSVTNQTRVVSFATETNLYYTLLTGTIVTNIDQPVSMIFGTGEIGVLRDTNAPAETGFYRVRALPLSQAADSDGDSIDDAYELSNASCLDPLNAADAGSDCDGDGRSNLTEYREGTSLAVQDSPPLLVINEVDYDQVGIDTREFVELLNVGTNAIDLTQFAVVFVNGVGSAEYSRVRLSGVLPPGEFALIGSSTLLVDSPATIKIPFPSSSDNFQNGAPDGLAIINVATRRIYDALSYEGSITAATINGFTGTYNLVEGTPVLGADSNTQEMSFQRFPSGTDTDNAAADWVLSRTVTPGTHNVSN